MSFNMKEYMRTQEELNLSVLKIITSLNEEINHFEERIERIEQRLFRLENR